MEDDWYEVHQTLDLDLDQAGCVRSSLDGAGIKLHRFYNEAVGYMRLDVVTESRVQGWDAARKLAAGQRVALEAIGVTVLRTKIEGEPWVRVPPDHSRGSTGTYYETHIKAVLAGSPMLVGTGMWSRAVPSQTWTVTLRDNAPPAPNEYTLRTHLMDVGVRMRQIRQMLANPVPWLGEPRTELVLYDDNRALDAEWEDLS